MTPFRDQFARNALKTAWHLLVRDLGGVDAVAACTRAARSMVSEYGSRASDRFPPADVILEAETVAGAPRVTAALALAQGFRLVRRDAAPAERIAALLSTVGATSGQVFAAAAAALADGRIDEREAATLRRALADLEQAAAHAIAALSPDLLPSPHGPAGADGAHE